MSDGMAEVASPCIKWCIIDRDRHWCAGCYRTLDEIAGWMMMNQSQRAKVVATCQARRASCDSEAERAGSRGQV